MAAKNSRLEEMDPDATTGMEFVEKLVDRMSTHADFLRNDIDNTEGADDLDTSDLYTEISREIDHYRWFLEAHLQGSDGQ